MNAAIYVRVSTAGQEAEGTSLGTQEADCRAYAAARRYQVVEVYREVHTGAELWERPRLSALRESVRRGQVNAIIAYALDRLSRSQTHIAILDDECERNNVAMLFVTEEFDKTPVGKLIQSAKGFAAEVERGKIKDRTIRGKRARVESGKLLPGCRPLYGYRFNENRATYDIDPTTAPIVRRIFADMAAGGTLRGIAGALTAEGVITPSGKADVAWQHTTVRCIITNPAYTGEAHGWRYTLVRDRQRNTRRAMLRPESEHVALPAGTIPPLIDAATFAGIGQRLRMNKERAARNNRHPENALLRAGFLRCGYCGAAMTATTMRDETVQYRCSSLATAGRHCNHGMRAHRLDPVVWKKIETILTKPGVIAEEVTRMLGEAESDDFTDIDLAAVDRALADVERRRTNVARLATLVDHEDDAAPLLDQIRTLGARRRQLEAERDGLLRQTTARVEARERLESLTDWCATVGANLRDFTYAEKRLALEALGVQVKLWGADHAPRYAITASIPLGDTVVDSTSW